LLDEFLAVLWLAHWCVD